MTLTVWLIVGFIVSIVLGYIFWYINKVLKNLP